MMENPETAVNFAGAETRKSVTLSRGRSDEYGAASGLGPLAYIMYCAVSYGRYPSRSFVRLGHCVIVRGARLGDGRSAVLITGRAF